MEQPIWLLKLLSKKQSRSTNVSQKNKNETNKKKTQQNLLNYYREGLNKKRDFRTSVIIKNEHILAYNLD